MRLYLDHINQLPTVGGQRREGVGNHRKPCQRVGRGRILGPECLRKRQRLGTCAGYVRGLAQRHRRSGDGGGILHHHQDSQLLIVLQAHPSRGRRRRNGRRKAGHHLGLFDQKGIAVHGISP